MGGKRHHRTELCATRDGGRTWTRQESKTTHNLYALFLHKRTVGPSAATERCCITNAKEKKSGIRSQNSEGEDGSTPFILSPDFCLCLHRPLADHAAQFRAQALDLKQFLLHTVKERRLSFDAFIDQESRRLRAALKNSRLHKLIEFVLRFV